MKRRLGLMYVGMTGLSLLLGCGGGGANTGTEAEAIEILRPFAGEALINSTNQPVKWSGGDAQTNVDIVFVPKNGDATVLSGNISNSGEADVRIGDLLTFDQRQGGTLQVVPTNETSGAANSTSSTSLRGEVPVRVGSLAAFSWNGTAEEYAWINVHSGHQHVVGTVGDMQSWTFNTLAVDHQQDVLHIVAFNAANVQKVYSLHSRTGMLLSDPPLTGIDFAIAGLVLTQSGKLVGFAWDAASNSEKIYALDTMTGVVTEMGTVGDLQYWQTETAYSPLADEIYVAGITASNESKLYVMNATSGALVRSVGFTLNGTALDNILGFAMNSAGSLIAYHWNGSSEQMLQIDTTSGAATEIGTVGDLQFWSTVADVNLTNDRAYVIGTNAANENKLYTLDTVTGALVDELVINEYPTNAVLVH